MNPKLVEFALRKQRLQIRAEQQREDMLRHLQGIEPVLDVADRARDGLAWLRAHAPLVTGVVVFVLVSRPRLAWRLAKRAWLGWVLFRRTRGGAGGSSAAVLAMPLLRGLGALLRSRLNRARRARAAAGSAG
ncbi:hypothetical protein CJ010_22440 [Azoarcus sp. DD4]|uniref:YqjK-like family protein n=1 Tax=Azoarcus sp. DD4 TaxID=2027405 RepID=UPI00112EB49D|nr:YqjK-like family protein [Azoarcus sp. DD4]MCM2332033.1 YqjK-like family protein [Pseudomonas sagittaria]QDF99101.1 hypothetical protein CJ010_22440 [Azoarcus sp. DD4]